MQLLNAWGYPLPPKISLHAPPINVRITIKYKIRK